MANGRNSKPSEKKPAGGFFRPTLTIPDELLEYFKSRINDPRHAGNASSYVRTLVIEERERRQKLEREDQAA